MPKNVTIYDVLISCPGDVLEELDVIDEVVEQFNQQYQDCLNIGIRTRHWSKSSYVQSGDKPQELLNKQFVNDCDAAIAIFATRFGTPTDKYGSGSEEEIEIMLQEGKQVFMYFSDKPVNPSSIITEQYAKVQAFKQKYMQRGLFYTYSSIEDFRKKLNAHLAQHFLSIGKIEDLKKKECPELELMSIRDASLCDEAAVLKFDLGGYATVQERKQNISDVFEQIKASPVITPFHELFPGGITSAFHKEVEVSDSVKKTIEQVAEIMEIPLPDTFFCLGNLSENPLNAAMMYGGRSLDGTKEEIKKYNLIIHLFELIEDTLCWIKISDCYKDLNGISFVLANKGTSFDEDIDISLSFPTEMLKTHDCIGYPGDRSFEDLIDSDCTLESIFSIPATELYDDYESSHRLNSISTHHVRNITPFPYQSRDYNKEYADDMDSVFQYQVFKAGEKTIVKLHVDYIRQHSKIAFPTPLFVTDEIKEIDISYNIVSKNNPQIIEKTIHITLEK